MEYIMNEMPNSITTISELHRALLMFTNDYSVSLDHENQVIYVTVDKNNERIAECLKDRCPWNFHIVVKLKNK